ncbi:MAG: cytochrome d ubiquinol oxidase subunit II [Silvibacterium sp.]
MHAPEMLLALILMISLTFYVLSGGADYGGGVWDLLASGPRRQQQRELISNAITPVWEANHVWLILVVVLLFAGFPGAFAAMTTALNIPLTVLIVGIVMSGSSFVFRAYHTGDDRTQRRWGLIFAIASTVTRICLGVVAGLLVLFPSIWYLMQLFKASDEDIPLH